jgi:hypothetical protein
VSLALISYRFLLAVRGQEFPYPMLRKQKANIFFSAVVFQEGYWPQASGMGTTLTFQSLLGYVMHQQFNIQQLYALPTLYLCVLYLSGNKQRLVPLTA